MHCHTQCPQPCSRPLLTHPSANHITSHIHNWVLFFLWLRLFILSGVISPQFSSSILGTCQPGCLHWKLLDTPRPVWVSLLWGHCSFLLGPGVHKALFVPSKSLFPQCCVCSGGSMVQLMVTSSKRSYAMLRSAAPRAPAPVASHC